MIVNALRPRLRRLLAVLSMALVATGGTVVLSAGPAHAALVFHGTFTIRSQSGECVGLQNNGTSRQTGIVLQGCDGSSGQRWAIFLATDQNNFWILAHGGAQPLNMCMDVNPPINSRNMWIWNCNGGRNQRFNLTPSTTGPQPITTQYGGDTNGQGTSSCVNSTIAGALAVQSCGKFPFTGTRWTLASA